MIQVVFQNKSFVVCNKPAQVLSVPAREKNDERPCLGTALQQELKMQIFPVHRLDYEVSGLIMYALDAKAHQISQEWFQHKKIRKIYEAVTGFQDFSHWPQNVKTERNPVNTAAGEKFIWKTKILRGKRRSFESEHGEWAETRAEIISAGKNIIWKLSPITGKSHQLRLELSRRGFPIHGDALYGSKEKHIENGIALKAVKIDLTGVENRLGLPEVITL